MFDEFRDLVRAKLETRPDEGPDRVLPLPEAIRRFVRPGMLLHLASTPGRPLAATYELMRQYRGRQPDFTLLVAGFVSLLGGTALVRSGLLKKVITAVQTRDRQFLEE